MPNTYVPPSTLDGIKRLAKTIKRECGISLHAAQDEAAQRAGYRNLRHAQAQLAAGTLATHLAYLSAYWRQRGAAGRETLVVALPKPLSDVVKPHHLKSVRELGRVRMDATDHLEFRVDMDSQEDAHRSLLAAARTLRFMAATGLRPATTREEKRRMDMLDGLPGGDHRSEWIHVETGAWVFMDEPYDKPELERRMDWCRSNGLQYLRPNWEGIYAPDFRPHVA